MEIKRTLISLAIGVGVTLFFGLMSGWNTEFHVAFLVAFLGGVGYSMAYNMMGDSRLYRVRYLDNSLTVSMSKKEAQNYANIYGGHIELAKDKNDDF